MECFLNPSQLHVDESPRKAFLKEEVKLSATGSNVQTNSIKLDDLLQVSSTAGLWGITSHLQCLKVKLSMRYRVARCKNQNLFRQ